MRASKRSIGLDEIVGAIDRMEKSELETLRFEEYDEQFPYLLWAAFALLVVEFLILDRKNPLFARFDLFGRREND